MPRGGGNTREAWYARLADLSREIDEEIDRFVGMRQDIEVAIGSVEDRTLQTLLRYRYINGMTWERIAVEMNYAYRWILKLHGNALSKIDIEGRGH